MTSAPIMWFSTYDFEHEKDVEHYNMKKEKDPKKEVGSSDNIQSSQVSQVSEPDQQLKNMKFFMKNPNLYSIGLTRECFSTRLLGKYIGYALWHAFVAYQICVYALNHLGVSKADGKELGLWIGGMTTYGICIFMANALLGIHAKTYDPFGIFLLFLGPIAYFLFYWLTNIVFVGYTSCLFANNFNIGIVWIAMLFCLIQQYIVDKAY